MARLLAGGVVAFAAASAVASCTATHPLDQYSEDYGKSHDAGGPEDAPPGDDAGDAEGPVDAGCVGNPTILEPLAGATINGATMRVRVSAPACLDAMIVYIDSKQVLSIQGSSLDQSFPISVGTHKLNVNAWAHTATAHPSPIITVTRPQ